MPATNSDALLVLVLLAVGGHRRLHLDILDVRSLFEPHRVSCHLAWGNTRVEQCIDLLQRNTLQFWEEEVHESDRDKGDGSLDEADAAAEVAELRFLHVGVDEGDNEA